MSSPILDGAPLRAFQFAMLSRRHAPRKPGAVIAALPADVRAVLKELRPEHLQPFPYEVWEHTCCPYPHCHLEGILTAQCPRCKRFRP